jgi:drug/metabolite transporter (DMT)-like permease
MFKVLRPNFQGALWKILACGCFALINGLVRALASSQGPGLALTPLPPQMLMFFQNLFGSLILWPLLSGRIFDFKTTYKALHALRIMTAVLGVYLWYSALQYLPIAEAVALSFLGPIFTVVAARLFLKEQFTPYKIYAVLISMLGAFLIARPDRGLFQAAKFSWAYALPLGSALLWAANTLITRKLAALGEGASRLALYLLLFMTPMSFLSCVGAWTTPELNHWPFLMGLGALAALAHYALGRAYTIAEVGFLMPFGFSKFFLSAFIGYILFAEKPATWSLWLGTLIIFSSICLLTHEKAARPI